MSTNFVQDIYNMHSKFGHHEAVDGMSPDQLKVLLKFRKDFLDEEHKEMHAAKTAAQFKDALIDYCVVAIGTLDLFAADPQEGWDKVDVANMAKETGVNPGRPNPLGMPDLLKPAGWTAPVHTDVECGLLMDAFVPEEN